MKKIVFYLLPFLFSASHSQNTNREMTLELISNARNKTKSEQWQEASQLWENITGQNPVNGEFWMQLATAYHKSANYVKAIPAYKKALELKWEMPCAREMDISRCYAQLNQIDSCYYWMQRALKDGYPELEELKTDALFVEYHKDARFKTLLWLRDVTKLSRVEGWNYDLNFLDYQIKRVAFNPYRKFSDKDFKDRIQYIRSMIPQSSDLTITAEFMRLIAMVDDGHSTLYANEETPELKKRIPIGLRLFKEGLFVSSADSINTDLIGLQVIAFDNLPTDTILRRILPFISKDNDLGQLYNATARLRQPALLAGMGLIKAPEKITLSLKDENGHVTQRVLYSQLFASNRNKKNGLIQGWKSLNDVFKYTSCSINPTLSFWFEYFENKKAVYFKFNAVGDEKNESLSAFTDRLFNFIATNETKKLIIDIRDNGGGNTDLLPPLLNKIMQSHLNVQGKLFCIIGRRTFSAAQNFATYLEKFTNVTFVGEPTGSNPNFIGEVHRFTLPYSKLQANISNLYWGVSAPQDTRTWIAPALYIQPSIIDLKEGKDPALETILSLE